MPEQTDNGSTRGSDVLTRRISPFALALTLLILLGLFTVLGYFFKHVEQSASYRILLFGVVVSCMVPGLAANLRREVAKDLDEAETAKPSFRPKLGLWISSGFLALVAVYIALTFFFPVLLGKARIRILTFASIVVYMLCYFGIEKTIGTRKLAAGLAGTAAQPESLARRFFASLAILLLLPIYFTLLHLFPALQGMTEMTIAVFGILAGALIGLWSVSRDILELLRILRKARMIAQRQTRDVINTSRKGEVSELANAFNVVIADLDETINELQLAKQRIELLLDRIGTAVTSSASMQDMLRVVLDISRDSLGARTGYLWIITSQSGSGELYSTYGSEGIFTADELQEKLDQAVQNVSACQEDHFLVVPLLSGKKALGALAVARTIDDAPFRSQDRDLLQSIANQAALAVEASDLRESEERIYLETISALALAVEAKDPYTRGHSRRVSEMATAIAVEMGLEEEQVHVIRYSGLLHDIGKLGVPDTVLRKTAPLSEAEYDLVKRHPVTGERIVNAVSSLHNLRDAIRHHHERVDGKGYPDGLKGKETDIKALILGAADALDAMLYDRPYRSAYSKQKAREEISKGAGTQFDPEVAQALLRLLDRGDLPIEEGEATRDAPHAEAQVQVE